MKIAPFKMPELPTGRVLAVIVGLLWTTSDSIVSNWWSVLVMVLGVLIVAALVTVALRSRRGKAWHQLAKRHGLRFEERDEGPRVLGELNGRKVEIRIAGESSDRELGGVEVLRMAVDLRDVPDDMTAEGEPGLIGDLVLAAEDRIRFQDDTDFDQSVLVQGDDAGAIRDYWTAARRAAFLRLVESAPCDIVRIENGHLVGQLREVVSQVDRLERLLDDLLRTADELDSGGT